MGRMVPPRSRGCFRSGRVGDEEYLREFRAWLKVQQEMARLRLAVCLFTAAAFILITLMIAVKKLGL